MLVKNQNRMANSVDPDETAHYELSHQDLHCLHRYVVWFAGLKGLNIRQEIVRDHGQQELKAVVRSG